MSNIYKIIFLCAAVSATALSLCSCRSGDRSAPIVSDELTISGLSSTKWTYFSFDTGQVVGQSTFLSAEEDKEWEQRLDWDFAICGDYIKTNGGDSGQGLGGIQRDYTSNFLTLSEAPEDGYLVDRTRIVRK
ncbi:MAG: HmuY family protein [Candidatus Cryptobacteroides sp.]